MLAEEWTEQVMRLGDQNQFSCGQCRTSPLIVLWQPSQQANLQIESSLGVNNSHQSLNLWASLVLWHPELDSLNIFLVGSEQAVT